MKTTPSLRPAANGSALIITLFFMSMITVVIVGVLISSRLERSVAHSHFDQKRAADLAREGVERVIATLDKQTAYKYTTTDPVTTLTAYRYRNYLTRPGGLIVPANAPTGTAADATTQNTLALSVPLSTGTPPSSLPTPPSVYAPPSLNIVAFAQQAAQQTDPSAVPQTSTTNYVIDDRPAKSTSNGTATPGTPPSAMKLQWVYIHQDSNATNGLSATYEDPVIDPSTIPTGDGRPRGKSMTDIPAIDARYPIIGRFAYWTDDESAKLNYNLAWKKSTSGTKNVSGMSDPSRIDLEALLQSSQSSTNLPVAQADNLHNWITMTPGRYFNSFEDARQIGQTDSKIPPVIEYNKFELTHYNHDPDTTFFGEDRILLTTNPRLVPKNRDGSYARKFIDILREDMTKGKDFRTIDPPDPGLPINIAGGETDFNGSVVPSNSSYYPGVTINNKLDMVIKNLVRYINQTNWPMCSDQNASFRSKYYPAAAANNPAVAQLAMAIIDYVRMRESAMPVIPGTRAGTGSSTTGPFTTDANTVSGNPQNAYQGYGRYPYCTEMGLTVETPLGGGVTQCEDGTSNGWPTIATGASAGKKMPLFRCCAQYEFYLPLRSNLPNGILLATPPLTAPPTERWTCTPIQGSDPANRWVEGEDLTMHQVFQSKGSFGGYQPAISTKNCVITNPPNSPTVPAGTLLPGGYAVVSIKYFRDKDSGTAPSYALRADLERNFVDKDGLSFVYQPGSTTLYADQNYIRPVLVPQATSDAITYKPTPTFTGGDFNAYCKTMISVETDDPRSCVAGADWVQGAKSSWGVQNTRYSAGIKAPNSSISPQQDADVNTGKISDYSLYMPPPKTSGTDPENGYVTSVGELGYVPTGLSTSSSTGGSVSWRTLRLQGNNYPTTSVVPDWAFADLFAVPNVTAANAVTAAAATTTTTTTGQTLYNPHGNTVGGRVNINSTVIPFTDLTHDRALVGLLAYATKGTVTASGAAGTPTTISPADAELLAKNIANQTLVKSIPSIITSPKTQKYGTMNLPQNPAYDTPGELCEIAGIGDQGEVGEDLFRQISSLTCTRGDVFSVYSIGQALQQSPSGKLVVTAEQRQQSMVERYVANKDTPSAIDDQVRFRTVYVRNLTP